MDQSLTAQQLYRDLVNAVKRPIIPEGAFTVERFATDANLSPQVAGNVLYERFRAGELQRIFDGRRYWYYFKTAEVLSE
jgi:hypothetical protein